MLQEEAGANETDPLPPNPKLIDRVEYALQWSACWMIVDIKGHPMVSGLCTGLLISRWDVARLLLLRSSFSFSGV